MSQGTAISQADAIEKDEGTPIVVGNTDNWQLLTKFVSGDGSVNHSTKAWQIDNGRTLVAI